MAPSTDAPLLVGLRGSRAPRRIRLEPRRRRAPRLFGASVLRAERVEHADRPHPPLAPSPALRADSSALVGAVADNNLPLTADPDQYTIPVYVFDASTPRTK